MCNQQNSESATFASLFSYFLLLVLFAVGITLEARQTERKRLQTNKYSNSKTSSLVTDYKSIWSDSAAAAAAGEVIRRLAWTGGKRDHFAHES